MKHKIMGEIPTDKGSAFPPGFPRTEAEWNEAWTKAFKLAGIPIKPDAPTSESLGKQKPVLPTH